ncbi:MAG: hypothetical protein WCP21_23845 [Armatimonadota bacterium]
MSDFMTRVQELGRLFLRSAKEGGEAAAEAIEHRAQIQRLALQVRRLDKERSGLIRQIGAKVYSLHGQAKVRNQDVLVDCKRIDDIIVDIAKLQKDIELIRAASLEKGIEVPILSDEAPLDEEEIAVTAVVTPAGTVGEQDLPAGGPGKSSEGLAEFDESGDPQLCDPGPSVPADPAACEADLDVELAPEEDGAKSEGP